MRCGSSWGRDKVVHSDCVRPIDTNHWPIDKAACSELFFEKDILGVVLMDLNWSNAAKANGADY